jgi:hypothetical protein
MPLPSQQFDEAWLNRASDMILLAPSLGDAIKVTSGFLNDLFNALASLREEEIQEGDYQDFITKEVALIDSTPSAADEGQAAMWELGRTVLLLDEKLPSWTDEKLRSEAFLSFGELLPPEKPLNDGIRTVLGSILAYHQGWLAGEALK